MNNPLRAMAEGFGSQIAPQAYDDARQRRMGRDIGNALLGGVSRHNAANIAFRGGDVQTGLQLQQMHQDDKNTALNRSHAAQQSQNQAQQLKQNQVQQQQAQQQASKSQRMQQLQQQAQRAQQLTLETLALPQAQRAAFFMRNGGLNGQTGPNVQMPDLSDAGLNQQMAEGRMMMAQLGIDIPAPPSAPSAPNGYRWNANGDLEPISGGPSDPRTIRAQTQARQVVPPSGPGGQTRAVPEIRTGPNGEILFVNPHDRSIEVAYGGGGGSMPGVLADDFDNAFWDYAGPPTQQQGFGGGQYYTAQAVDGAGPLDNAGPDDVRRPSEGEQAEYETYRGRARGSGDAERLQSIQETAQAVTNTGNVRIDAMESLLQQGVKIGPMAGARIEASRLLPGTPVTMNEEELAALSQFRRLGQEYALEIGEQMKGAFSDADREFVQQSLNANMRPEEAQGVLNGIRAVNDRLLLHADAASVWDGRYGGLTARDEQGRDFDTAWRAFQRQNPVFQNNASAGTEGAGNATTGITEDDIQETMRIHGMTREQVMRALEERGTANAYE